MNLTVDLVRRFKGGQMIISDPAKGKNGRGEVSDITIANGKLRVTFDWFAEADGLPPKQWLKKDTNGYEVDVALCLVSSLGRHPNGGGDRIYIAVRGKRETIILIPSDGVKLETVFVQPA